MPYIVSVKSFNAEYPDNCPYCSIPDALSKFNQPFSKMDFGMIPTQFKSKTWKVMLPACDSCANTFKHSRVGYFSAGFSALIFPIFIIAVPQNFQLAAAAAWGLLIIVWAALLVFRMMKLRAFKVVYVGKGEVAFSSTNQKYAAEFASLNNTEIEEKAFLVRLS
ncbi:MAG: DUF983 domain-containing protein [Desulfobacterales bacterium]|nr:DUF983 domain-containing protein [Desulfobacterales bacterium]